MLHGIPPHSLLTATFDQRGLPQVCNDAWTQTLGPISRVWGCLSEEDQQVAHHALEEAKGGTMVTHVILSCTAPNDETEPQTVLLHFIPIVVDGLQVGVNVIGESLTVPHSWTASQTRRHRFETLGRMTAGVVHDVNNLLSAILGHTEVLREMMEHTHSSEEPPPSIGIIEQAIFDTASVLNRLQRYLKQEYRETYVPLDLVEIIQDAIGLTRPYWFNEARRTGRHIDVLFTPPEGMFLVQGSRTELREVFTNLILNAVEAMPKGGHVEFTLSTLRDEQTWKVEIRDTGVGIPQDILPRIYEPLFTTKGADGNGMGLALSRSILKTHDAEIEVTSSPGIGTTFTLLFPRPDLGASEPTDALPIALPQLRLPGMVLLVDDEPRVSAILARLLTRLGYTVHKAHSGAEAIALCGETPYDIVITDQAMPGMSGRDLARWLKEYQHPCSVVLLTGETLASHADPHIDSVLEKPIRSQDLDLHLQRLLKVRAGILPN